VRFGTPDPGATETGEGMTWRTPGTTIEGVFTIGDDPFVIVPLTVVSDTADLTAHFIPCGTRYLSRAFPDGSRLPRVMTVDDFRSYHSILSLKSWKRHALVTTTPTSASAIRAWWTGDWMFGGWYVNLQEPLRRTATGFVTEDHFLDILVAPGLTWTWKDEDELDLAVERGRLTLAKARAIRIEGERVIDLVERAAFPFDGSLVDWRPDIAWSLPVLGSECNAILEET